VACGSNGQDPGDSQAARRPPFRCNVDGRTRNLVADDNLDAAILPNLGSMLSQAQSRAQPPQPTSNGYKQVMTIGK
jgi:hypothetical protein